MLKLSVRSRGALLGLMSWLGYALFITPLFIFGKPGILIAIGTWLAPITPIFHPNVLRWLLGNWTGDSFSPVYAFAAAVTFCGWFRPGIPVANTVTRSVRGAGGTVSP